MRVFETDRPIDSDYPVKKEEAKGDESKDLVAYYNWKEKVRKVLEKRDVTNSFYQKAVILLYSGKYKELRYKLILDALGKYSFFICPFGNCEIDHNYEFVIKPLVKQFQFKIERADEISHTKTITEVILEAIIRSAFIIADLTDAHPNCYYEVGYAHSLGKPIIILAKDSTMRHFDISTYKWNYWVDYKDLKPKLEKELVTLLTSLGIKTE
ncbi:MAG TPA: hypothetical protein VLU95_02685 [Candidatus Acidoferrum sp.]|nr:hypothetical protein [Candidatus Acidoferrum sp.]